MAILRYGLYLMVIGAIQCSKELYVRQSTINALVEKKETELLYYLALGSSQGKINIDDDNSIYSALHQDDLPRYQQLQVHHAEKELLRGNLLRAAQHFEDTGDKARALELCEKLLENPLEHWETAFQAAYKFENRRERLTGIVQKALQSEKKLRSRHFVQALHKLCERECLRLPPEDQKRLEEAVVITSNSPQELKPEQYLLWAKTHVQEQPCTAYAIFQRHKYEGPEVLQAVKIGLQKPWKQYDDQRIGVSDVLPQHLQAVYVEMPLEIQVVIAYKLCVKKLLEENELLRLSGKCREQGKLREAYHLWADGNGDLHDASFQELRGQLIHDALQEKYGSSFSFLHQKDQEGYQQAIDLIQETRAEKAYELAWQSRQEPLIQRTRDMLLQQEPGRALKLFQGKKDQEGVTMALQALAQKYEIPLATVEKYVR